MENISLRIGRKLEKPEHSPGFPRGSVLEEVLFRRIRAPYPLGAATAVSDGTIGGQKTDPTLNTDLAFPFIGELGLRPAKSVGQCRRVKPQEQRKLLDRRAGPVNCQDFFSHRPVENGPGSSPPRDLAPHRDQPVARGIRMAPGDLRDLAD